MLRVYALDDDAMILRQITNDVPWLEFGAEIIGSNVNPRAALEEIEALAPDVVFCDLKMPGIDGLELMRRAKEAGAGAEWVMLSAFGSFEDSRTFFLQGGLDYILKPLNIEEIQLVMQKLTCKRAGGQPPAPPGPSRYAPVGVEPFDEMIAYIQENYTEKFTLEKMSHQFHLSAGYICNLFAKHYATTFISFVTDVRMHRAAALVREGVMPLKEVALACGYASYFYFCKQFKAYYGCAPSIWRDNGYPPPPAGAAAKIG